MSPFAKQLFLSPSAWRLQSLLQRSGKIHRRKIDQTYFAFLHSLNVLYLNLFNCHLKENEVAEVQPPPVILYPQSQDQSHNNGAGHYSQGGPVVQPIEPPPQPPVDPRYPPQYDPRFPDSRHTGQTDGRLATQQTENRYPVTPQRRPSRPVPQPAGHVETSGSAVSILLLVTYQRTYVSAISKC